MPSVEYIYLDKYREERYIGTMRFDPNRPGLVCIEAYKEVWLDLFWFRFGTTDPNYMPPEWPTREEVTVYKFLWWTWAHKKIVPAVDSMWYRVPDPVLMWVSVDRISTKFQEE